MAKVEAKKAAKKAAKKEVKPTKAKKNAKALLDDSEDSVDQAHVLEAIKIALAARTLILNLKAL